MTLYAIYTPARQELATEAAIIALGIRAECAKRVDLIRQGKRRWPDAVVSSMIPNYVFAWLSAVDWHRVAKIKTVRDFIAISRQEECGGIDRDGVVRLGVTDFLNRANADYRKRMDQIEVGERVAEYEAGDVLSILSGPFAGQLATFRRMVESRTEIFPQIEAELPIMGHATRIKLDPLAARKSTPLHSAQPRV